MADYGTDPHLLVRTHDPDTSHAAAHSADTTRLEQMVYEQIASYGSTGCIAADLLADFPHYPYSSITARFRALVDKHLIVRGPDKRPGTSGKNQLVMRVVRYRKGRR